MARADQGKGGGYQRSGYAAAGHPTGEGSDGNVHRRSCAANPVVRGAERAGVYPKAAGGGHRRRESPRRQIRPPADPGAGEFYGGLSPLEIWGTNRNSSDKALRHATFYFPIQGKIVFCSA